jgi:Rrf2 family protein
MAVKISKKSEYAVRALVEITRRSRESDRWWQIPQIAESTGIPEKFLEQILLALKNGGFLKSKRGIDGGYALNLPPDQITLDQIVVLLEGRLNHEPTGDGRANESAKVFAEIAGEADAAAFGRLAAVNLSGLLDTIENRERARTSAAEYQI